MSILFPSRRYGSGSYRYGAFLLWLSFLWHLLLIIDTRSPSQHRSGGGDGGVIRVGVVDGAGTGAGAGVSGVYRKSNMITPQTPATTTHCYNKKGRFFRMPWVFRRGTSVDTSSSSSSNCATCLR